MNRLRAAGRPRSRLIIFSTALVLSGLLVAAVGFGLGWTLEQRENNDSRFPADTGPSKIAGVRGSGLALLSPSERLWLTEHPTIRVTQDPGWPPVEFALATGEPAGISNDFVKLIEQRLDIKFQRVTHLTWQESYRELKRWDIDMTTSVAKTPDREAFWAFTEPYIVIPIVILAPMDVTYIAGMDQLAGKRVALVEGYAAAEWVAHDYPSIQQVKVANVEEGFQRLQRGEAFAFVDNMLVISYYMAKLKVANLKIAGTTPYVNAQRMAVRKDWPVLASILQKTLASVSEAERDQIYNKWVPVRYEHGFDYRLLWQILGGFSVVLGGLLLWIRKLSKEIRYRRTAEAALRKSESLLRQTQEVSRVGGWEYRVSGGDMEWTEEMYRIHEVEPDYAPGSVVDYIRFYPNEEQGRIAQAIQRLLDCGESYDLELPLVTAAGHRVWVRTVAHAEQRNGAVVRAYGNVMDVTDRKHAEQELANEKERLAVTLRSIGDGVITSDVSGRVGMLNRAAELLTGWSTADAAGRPFPEIFRIVNELTLEPCENPVERVLATGGVAELANPTCLVARDGRRVLIADSAAPIRDRESRVVGVVLVFRDMTEKQRLAESMQRAQKLESLGVLAGGIAHDFNNLLGGIFGYLDMATESLAEDRTEEAAACVKSAAEVFERAKALTQQLLTFSKGGAPVRKTLALAPIVAQSVQFALSGSNVSSQMIAADDLWLCDCDRHQIGQVIDNIVINAKQAMPDGGSIVVTLENVRSHQGGIGSEKAPAEYVKISIQDRGAGMPKEVLARIFDPFYSTKETGHGLGLATVFSIVQRHDGYLDVVSVPGQGSTFHVFLPASHRSPSYRADLPKELAKGRGTFLVMDDEGFMLDVVTSHLQAAGYQVVRARDGAEAVRLFSEAEGRGESYVACILDLTVPGGMGGKEAALAIRSIRAEAILVASSGYSEDPVMASPEHYGFSDRIVKPFRKAELAELLHRVHSSVDRNRTRDSSRNG